MSFDPVETHLPTTPWSGRSPSLGRLTECRPKAVLPRGIDEHAELFCLCLEDVAKLRYLIEESAADRGRIHVPTGGQTTAAKWFKVRAGDLDRQPGKCPVFAVLNAPRLM